MNIKRMRSVHLYLGVFFAPLLIFFILSGCWQTFDLHQANKSNGSYRPPGIIKSLSQVHMNQRWISSATRSHHSIPFRYLILLMCIGLLVSIGLGIVMPFKYTRPWIVCLCLSMGVLTPYFLIWLGCR